MLIYVPTRYISAKLLKRAEASLKRVSTKDLKELCSGEYDFIMAKSVSLFPIKKEQQVVEDALNAVYNSLGDKDTGGDTHISFREFPRLLLAAKYMVKN